MPDEPNPNTHGLFGFMPEPATGKQRKLFEHLGDIPGDRVALPMPEYRPSTVSKTWPRPWAKPDAADRRIAKKFRDEDTQPMF